MLENINKNEILIKYAGIPKYLFKYVLANNYTEKIISDNELFFSYPTNFNDNLDCYPAITKFTKDEFQQYLMKVAGGEPSEKFKNIDENSDEYKIGVNSIIKDGIRVSINKNVICCFSDSEYNKLMWSHYADNNKGICLKFDILEDDTFFEYLQLVEYTNKRPVLNLSNIKDMAIKIVTIKHIDWAYENETRIIKTEPKQINAKKEVKEKGKIFAFNSTALKEIIFGTNTANEIKQRYYDLCQTSNKKHIKFFEVKLDDIYYKINKIEYKK